jgi:hypothetical protein
MALKKLGYAREKLVIGQSIPPFFPRRDAARQQEARHGRRAP